MQQLSIKCSAAALINLDVELAMQEQIQSLQQQLSMKVLHTPSSNVPPWIWSYTSSVVKLSSEPNTFVQVHIWSLLLNTYLSDQPHCSASLYSHICFQEIQSKLLFENLLPAGPAPGAFIRSLSFFIGWRSTSRAGFCCPRLRLSSLGSEQSH